LKLNILLPRGGFWLTETAVFYIKILASFSRFKKLRMQEFVLAFFAKVL
jgi:hypothetical protein